MRVRALLALGILALAAVAVALPLAHGAGRGGAVLNCAHRSQGSFDAFHNHHNIVVGPLALDGGADDPDRPLGDLERIGWVKNPALILPGHRVTLAIAPTARRRAGLLYVHHRQSHAPPLLSDSVPKVTFVACDRAHSDSRARGRPVTFFSGGFVATTYPACVPIDVRVDHQRRIHRLTISLGAGDCGRK